MHNVEFLEKEWFKLKLKKSLIKVVIAILIIVILSIAFSFIYLKVDFSKLNGLIKFKKEEVKIKTTPTPLLTPTEIPLVEDEVAPIYKDIIEEEKIIDEKIKTKPHNEIISISTTQKDFLTILKDKFTKNPNYTTAISIAEEYLKKEKFAEALKWSIRANEFDDRKEDSWLIFAKAKEKLNKLEEAINALKIYLNKNQSSKIRELLNQLVKKEKVIKPIPTLMPKVENKKEMPKFEQKESLKEILTKIKIIKKAYYTYPNAKDALHLAKEYVKIKNYKNCMFWAEKLIKILPHNEVGYIYYGTCAPKERFFTKSIEILQDYLKEDPNNEKIKSLIEKIKIEAKE